MMKSARRRAREGLVQGLYQSLLAGHGSREIEAHLLGQEHLVRADKTFFSNTLSGILGDTGQLDAMLAPFLDRAPEALSPVERSILWLAAFELRHHPETPFRVIINEAVELAKRYGGTDGHKYVNGVLDRLAAQERPLELRSTPSA